MRIAYISYEYPPDSCNGGIATYVGQAARMMAQRGHEVEVFASSPFRQGRVEADGIIENWVREVHRQDFGIVAGHVFAARHAEKPFDILEGPEYNADARKAVELVPAIPLVVKMHTPSLIIKSLNAPSGFVSYILNLPYDFRVLNGNITERKPIQLFFLATLRRLHRGKKQDKLEAAHARRADIVAPPCQDLCNYAKAIWKIPEAAIRLAPHPFTPIRNLLELRPRAEGSTVGFVGRLEKRKGIETLAAAIPPVLKAMPQARFRFIGGSGSHPVSGVPYDEWLRLRTSRFAGRLEILGKYPVERMPEAYDGLDVCVFPSLWENFPNVCLEAMSAGKAVIASSAGGVSGMLDHGRVGRLIASGDSVALAREIILLLKYPAERIRLGELARKRVLEVYNEKVIGEMMERIYREAINHKADTTRAGHPKPDRPE